MQVNLSTDNHIDGGGRKDSYWSGIAQEKLKRHEDHITSLEIHVISHNSSAKQGVEDKECKIEARLIGRPNQSVSCKSDLVEKSISGALDKMKHLLDHTYDKLKAH